MHCNGNLEATKLVSDVITMPTHIKCASLDVDATNVLRGCKQSRNCGYIKPNTAVGTTGHKWTIL
jgi:hypothetical protein